MKKVLYIFIAMFLMFGITGCDNEKKEEMPEINRDDIKFYERNSFLDKEDGWVYYFHITLHDDGSFSNYHFDGMNMKYRELENYYIPVFDKETGEEVQRFTSSDVSLSIDQVHREEYQRINDFFEDKAFTKEITMEDLADLETDYFSKEDILYLFNEAIKNDEHSNFVLGPQKYTSIDVSKTIDNCYWQVALLIDYGYPERVRIDYICNDTNSLRDNVEKGKKYDKDMYKKILEIEDYILKNSTKAASTHFNDLPDAYDSLLVLLRDF